MWLSGLQCRLHFDSWSGRRPELLVPSLLRAQTRGNRWMSLSHINVSPPPLSKIDKHVLGYKQTNLKNRNSIRKSRDEEDSEWEGRPERGPESHGWTGRDSHHGGPCPGHRAWWPGWGCAEAGGREQPAIVARGHRELPAGQVRDGKTGTVLRRPLTAALRGGRRSRLYPRVLCKTS